MLGPEEQNCPSCGALSDPATGETYLCECNWCTAAYCDGPDGAHLVGSCDVGETPDLLPVLPEPTKAEEDAAHGEHEAFPDLDAPDLSNGWEAFDKALSADLATEGWGYAKMIAGLNLRTKRPAHADHETQEGYAREYEAHEAEPFLKEFLDLLGPCPHEKQVTALLTEVERLKRNALMAGGLIKGLYTSREEVRQELGNARLTILMWELGLLERG